MRPPATRVRIGSLVACDAGEVHVREDGPADGPVVVLLHGFTSSVHSYDLITPLLADTFRVVVAAEGYAGASVQAIARRAGVSRKTFYECFDDKRDAFLAAYRAVDLLIERTITAAADSASAGSSPRDLVAAAIRALLRTLAADPAFTRMFFLEALGAGARVRRRRDAAIEQVVAVLTPALTFARSLQDPPLAPIGADLARAIIGAGIEAVVRHLVHHEPETLDQLAEPLTRLIDSIVLT